MVCAAALAAATAALAAATAALTALTAALTALTAAPEGCDPAASAHLRHTRQGRTLARHAHRRPLLAIKRRHAFSAHQDVFACLFRHARG